MVGWWLWRAGCISQDTYLLYQRLVLFSCIYVTGECRWAVDCSCSETFKKRKSKHYHQPGLPEKSLPPKEQLNAFTTLPSSALTPMKVGAVCGCKGSISNPMHLTLSWVCQQVERGLKMGVLEMERVTLKQETVVAFVRNCSLYNQVCLSQHLQIAPHLVPYLFADSRENQTARKKIITTQKNDGASERRRGSRICFFAKDATDARFLGSARPLHL